MSLKRRLTRGGGWPAIWYSLRAARKSGGIIKFLRAMRSKNACKTCALGMGGQMGGMTDEAGKFPEVCKKSMQAMAADMQSGLTSEFFARYSLDELRQFTPRDLEHMGRIVQPVYAGPNDSHYLPISWDEAIEKATGFLSPAAPPSPPISDIPNRAANFSSCDPGPPSLPRRGLGVVNCGDEESQQTSLSPPLITGEAIALRDPNEAFFYASGRASNEAAYLMQLFARVYGTNNVNNCSYYCHQASGVGLSQALGTGTATVVLEDLEQCDLLFLIGGNPASNHPRLMRALMNLRRRGGDVVVVNPIRETGLVNFALPSDLRSLFFGSPIASIYVQPHIGGDIAFLSGVAKLIDEAGHCDEGFLSACTDDSAAFRQHLRALSWDDLVRQSGVSKEVISTVAGRYARSERTIFAWTMGITHHLHGVENVRTIVNLALLRGMAGRPGAGLLPIRGHSNVQGVGSMGVAPKLSPTVKSAIESHFGISLPTASGLDTLACIDAMHEGKLRTGWCLGGNLFGASPDANRAQQAMSRLDSMVYFNTTLNTGHVHGRARETLILPVLARDEEPQPTTQESMFNYVRLSEGGPQRHEGPRSEVDLVASIAERVLGNGRTVNWSQLRDHDRIRSAIAGTIPGYSPVNKIGDTHREFQVAGRTMHEPRFATPTGKASLGIVRIPNSAVFDFADSPLLDKEGVGGGRLRLMTIRSEGQFNTVVYEEEDIYRHQDRRDVILMNADDICRFKLQIDQRVVVRSEAGEMRGILVREWDIRAGNAAMYYPEANVLVPPAVDPQSRTPAFKSVIITLLPDTASKTISLNIDIPQSSQRPRKLNAC